MKLILKYLGTENYQTIFIEADDYNIATHEVIIRLTKFIKREEAAVGNYLSFSFQYV